MDAARAGSAQEFRAKYEGKRITKKMMEQIPLIERLYGLLYPDEAIDEEGKLTLYDKLNARLERMDAGEAAQIKEQAARYYSLVAWALQESRVAKAHLEAADNAIFNAAKILDSIKQAEDIRHYSGHAIAQTPGADEALGSLSLLDIDNLFLDDGNGWALSSTYANINRNIRYATLYNAIIRVIAEALQLPEFEQLQVSLSHVLEGQNIVNEAAQNLTEALSYRFDETEPPEEKATGFMGVNGIYHDKTHKLVEEAMIIYRPIFMNIEADNEAFDKEIKDIVIENIKDILNGEDDTEALSFVIEVCAQKGGVEQ